MRLAVAAVLLALSASAFAATPDPKTEEEKTVYALGALMSRSLKEFHLNQKQVDQVQKGLTDSLTGKKLEVDLEKQAPKFQEFVKAYAPAEPGGAAPKGPKPTADSANLYMMGVILSRNLKELSLTPAQISMMEKGMSDALFAKKTAVDPAQYESKIQDFAKARMAAASDARKTKEAAEAAKFASQPGAQKTASGLVFIPVRAGTGPSPGASDKVKVNYEGKLLDGTIFDSSYKRGQPIEFPLNGVIPCWTEGVQKMKVGGEATLVCPSSIAYGDRGSPPAIPPGATLVFKVELLGVTPAAPAK
jgi:FKBP-type peptidyl-prolyl cis-trans isomerase